MESAYETCLCHELSLLNLKAEKQKVIPIRYKGILLDAGYRLDLVVEGRVNVKALFQTGREKSTENGDKIDRIAGDRDVIRPHEVVDEYVCFSVVI